MYYYMHYHWHYYSYHYSINNVKAKLTNPKTTNSEFFYQTPPPIFEIIQS